MNISYNQLRQIKHSLPTGSVSKIANQLKVDEQTVRNYFGAQKFTDGQIASMNIEPGPDGGIVSLEDTTILNAAKEILASSSKMN